MAKGINSSIKGNKNKIAVIMSPVLTNEEIFAVWSLFRKKLNLPNLLDKTHYHRLASYVHKDRIDPDIVSVLDKIVQTSERAQPV